MRWEVVSKDAVSSLLSDEEDMLGSGSMEREGLLVLDGDPDEGPELDVKSLTGPDGTEKKLETDRELSELVSPRFRLPSRG